MGWVVDRYGFAIPAFTGAIMVSLGGLLTSVVSQPWQLLAIYGVMFGLSGQGALAAPAMTNISRWYEQKRAMAVGMVSSGQALAGIIWLPIFGWAVDLIGWRDLYYLFGAVALMVLMPVAWFVRHKPPKVVERTTNGLKTTDSEKQIRTRGPTSALSNATIQVLNDCNIRLLPGNGHATRPFGGVRYRCWTYKNRRSNCFVCRFILSIYK